MTKAISRHSLSLFIRWSDILNMFKVLSLKDNVDYTIKNNILIFTQLILR